MNTETRGRRIEIPVNRPVLRALREAKYPNASEAARAADISPGTLHDIESGRRNGTKDTLRRIAKALGVDLSVITRSEDEAAA